MFWKQGNLSSMYSSAWIFWGIVVCDGELEHKKAKWGWQVCAFLTTSPLTIGKFKFKERVILSSSWSEWAAQTSANISWPLAKAPSVCDAVLKSSSCQGPASPVATWRFWCKVFLGRPNLSSQLLKQLTWDSTIKIWLFWIMNTDKNHVSLVKMKVLIIWESTYMEGWKKARV